MHNALARRRNPAVLAGVVLLLAALGFVVLVQAPTARTIGAMQRAPDFTIATWNTAVSRTIRLAALKGHPVLVNFWAPWCVPCQHEAPVLAAAAHTYTAQGVDFVGIVEQVSRQDSLLFLRRYGITYPCGPDSSAAAAVYAVPGIPVTVLINRQGFVARKIIGQVTPRPLGQALASFLR